MKGTQLPLSDRMPIAWTIAGSDSGGGAGIQVDLKVMNALGVHGCSVITALTAQNSCGVQAIQPTPETLISAQIKALADDLPAQAIKSGMIGSKAACRALIKFYTNASTPRPPLICDPVLKSTSGSNLLEPTALELLKRELFPYVTVLTPNLPETEHILGHAVKSIESAAAEILEQGVQSVLIKGGHSASNECKDYWTNGTASLWLSSPRRSTRATHGTGCILSSAIASGLAMGQTLQDAIIQAKAFLNQCLRHPAGLGQGHGPMRILPFENATMDQPITH